MYGGGFPRLLFLRGEDMDVIVCLDDKGGMMFNNRRQSKDRAVFDDIKALGYGTVMIDAFSEKLFADSGIAVKVGEPEGGDVFFAENRRIGELLYRCGRIIIYKWNRVYPSDFNFDIDLEKEGFALVQTKEFAGNSHDKITREIYVR